MWRGSGTGGGATELDNQRFKLHHYSELWKADARYNGSGGDGQKFLDAAVIKFSKRDKKVKGAPMGCDDHTALPFEVRGRPDFVPMFEQARHKYLIYVEGHCAANRYAYCPGPPGAFKRP
jgi:hypothetical protein